MTVWVLLGDSSDPSAWAAGGSAWVAGVFADEAGAELERQRHAAGTGVETADDHFFWVAKYEVLTAPEVGVARP